MSETTRTLEYELEQRIRRELPHLDVASIPELIRILTLLIERMQPERVFVFGSMVRGDVTADSDVDLLVVVRESEKQRYERAQDAYVAIGLHSISVDIIVLTLEEFVARRGVPSSLAATALREGKTLYAA